MSNRPPATSIPWRIYSTLTRDRRPTLVVLRGTSLPLSIRSKLPSTAAVDVALYPSTHSTYRVASSRTVSG
jgi:hypothetical protein